MAEQQQTGGPGEFEQPPARQIQPNGDVITVEPDIRVGREVSRDQARVDEARAAEQVDEDGPSAGEDGAQAQSGRDEGQQDQGQARPAQDRQPGRRNTAAARKDELQGQINDLVRTRSDLQRENAQLEARRRQLQERPWSPQQQPWPVPQYQPGAPGQPPVPMVPGQDGRAGPPQQHAIRNDQGAVVPIPPEVGPPPTSDQFDSIADFDRAKDAWSQRFTRVTGQRAGQEAAQAVINQWQQQQAAAAEQARLQAQADRWQGELARVHAEHPDFKELSEAGRDIMITPAMHELMMVHPNGAEILYDLARNPDECRAMSRLDERSVPFAMGDFFARHVAPRLQQQQTTTSQPSGAASPGPQGQAPSSRPVVPARPQPLVPVRPISAGADTPMPTLQQAADRGDTAAYRARRFQQLGLGNYVNRR